MLVALLAAGCSGAPLPTDLERAQAIEGHGHDEDALAAWRAVREGCPRPDARPHNDCGLAATREAQLLESLGHDLEAASAWEALPSRTADPRQAAHGLARAAEIAAERLADPERALRAAWRCIEDYHDEVPADDALAVAVRIERARDPKVLLARLDALAARFPTSDLADNLLFVGGEVALGAGDAGGAISRWDDLDRRFPRSSLRDDANWRAAHLLHDQRDFAGTLERLRRLVRTRRVALIVGSYNSEWLDDAQLMIGRVLLDDLHDVPGAIEAFMKLPGDYPNSTLRDDALFELARAHLGAHTPPNVADRAAACEALSRLLHQFPDGNMGRAARARAAELACP